jgi:peptidoglycan/LPS O-acetylase OafA/YrhL
MIPLGNYLSILLRAVRLGSLNTFSPFTLTSRRLQTDRPHQQGSMTGMVQQAPRIGWLDGLRGIAAMQVVLLHYTSTFLPAIAFTEPLLAHYSWEQSFIKTPLGFLLDGSSAVYLFFIVSGVALTHAFNAHPFDFLPAILRRLIRLGVPMAASVLLAAALFSLLPDASGDTAKQTNSEWFAHAPPWDMTAVAHQIAFEGMLTGFSTSSLLPGWVTQGLGLMPSAQALNPPLWTLHVEFYGSLLILLLVSLRAVGNRTAYLLTGLILASSSLFTLNPLSLFVVGHVAAHWLRRTEMRWWHAPVGIASLTSGILLCTAGKLALVSMLLSQIQFGRTGDWEVLQKMIGAVLVFGGLALLPILQRQLERPATRWLGKISFSLYLTHYPLLFTCVAALFTVLHHTLPYASSIAIAIIAGIATSIAIAVPFERWIDRPSIVLSRSRRAAIPEPA